VFRILGKSFRIILLRTLRSTANKTRQSSNRQFQTRFIITHIILIKFEGLSRLNVLSFLCGMVLRRCFD
jgi:hypothetical protein